MHYFQKKEKEIQGSDNIIPVIVEGSASAVRNHSQSLEVLREFIISDNEAERLQRI